MKRENYLNLIGFCMLGAAFLFALIRVFGFDDRATADGRAVLRFAHWQLEGGLRDAFEQLARDYERLHPDVRVEQLAIPERTYAQWIKTQLVGGTTPDIVQLGRGTDTETVARYFVPLGDAVEQPNPYNAGTPLAETPWRDTILDGMAASPSYYADLLENYGAPVSMFTVRVYYNRDLWRRILGDTPPPRTYDEFLAVFPRVEDFNRRTGRTVLPIAGSRSNAPMLINAYMQNQTQRLVQDRVAGPALRANGPELGLALLSGDWTLRDPAYLDALDIARTLALRMPPGFMQLGREDASFYFIQGRALMITTGSWDSPSFRSQVEFDLGVFQAPLPTAEHPRYGRNLQGRSSEAEVGTGLVFGITRQSASAERALDFLRFLASQPHNTRFTELSGWLPSVVGVVPPSDIEPFLPEPDGYVPGFDFSLSQIGPDTVRTIETASNRLFSPHGSVEDFVSVLEDRLPAGVKSDLRRVLRNGQGSLARQDIALLGWFSLGVHDPSDSIIADKITRLLEAQNSLETSRAWLDAKLNQLETDEGKNMHK